MKVRFWVTVGGVGAALLLTALCRQKDGASVAIPSERRGISNAQEFQTIEVQARTNAATAHGEPAVGSSPDEASESASADADSLIVMYEAMAEALEGNGSNCGEAAAAVDRLIDSNLAAIKRLAGTSIKPLPLVERREARLNDVRRRLQVGITRCQGDAALLAAMKRVAVLGAAQ